MRDSDEPDADKKKRIELIFFNLERNLENIKNTKFAFPFNDFRMKKFDILIKEE